MSSNDNAKVSDSGYTNTCENSQSHGSSGSSLSRNSNRSESSGYCGGHPSIFGFSNEAIPQPISTKKEKEHKKKKSKTSTTINSDIKPTTEGTGQQTDSGTYSLGSNVSNQKLKKSEEVGIVELVDATDSGEHNGDSNSIAPKGELGSQTNPLDNTSPNANGEFYTVISLHDGLVVHSTASLQKALGYSKDNWIGRSFIDFIYSKDRQIFAEKLASGVVLLFRNRKKGFSKCQTNLFCNLRRCTEPLIITDELDNKTKQFRKKQKTMCKGNNNSTTLPYVPFHLSLGFKHFRERRRADGQKMMLLTITAEPTFSAYKAPEELIMSSTFSTHHSPNCFFSHVDDDVVKYFGYLPQDMVGRSLFDFYHPEDLPLIKDIYKTVVRLDGSSFRSKPYRFAVQNGGYVVLETEWSSFINPWERKLEFIVGHHRVLRGPVNPDVFQPPDEDQRNYLNNINEQMLSKESMIIQNEIRQLLSEIIQTSIGITTYDVVKQSTELSSYVDNLIPNPKKSTPMSCKVPMITEERTLPEHDSVILGEISPHHEYCDSKSSSETPPSYNQLNYNEKIERFFNSKPLFKKSVGVVELVDATDPGEHNSDSNGMASKRKINSQANRLFNTSPNVNEEFYTVVSLQDGLILNSTASLQTALGYLKDSWNGRSFLDFIHPKDHETFTDKLVCSIVLPMGDQKKDLNECQTNVFCNLRRFCDNELENKMDMETEQDRKKQKSANDCREINLYDPFHLSMGFKSFQINERDKKLRMLLTITAEPVFSAYKAPEENIISSTFLTRHTATCHFSYVDDDVVQYFGYLPQDMVGRSLFDFYHPEDLPFIKDIYETVVRLDGSSFRSKPYRFAVQNGGYVVLETEWSFFINPWERKLEFIVGHHRVLCGPINPDVFQPPDEGQRRFLANISEEVFKESQIIQDEILALLAEKIPPSTGMSTYNLIKKSSGLTLLMENIIHEVKKPFPASKAPVINNDRSFSEHDSVMLGEISPHHEYCDSKSSSETPPSYNQLNYNEKIERFFNSKPLLTTVYGSDEEKVQSSLPSNDDSKTSANLMISNPTPPNQDSGGSGSGENLSSDSINQTSPGKDDNGNGNSSDPMTIGDSKLPTLTETLLNKHNQDMEKLMMLQHKERRSNIKNSKLNKDARMKVGAGPQEEIINQQQLQAKVRGCKRKNDHIRDGQFIKVLRHDQAENNFDKNNTLPAARHETKVDKVTVNQTSGIINVWPRITFATPHHSLDRIQNAPKYSAFSQVIPIYYMPVPQNRTPTLIDPSHRIINHPPPPPPPPAEQESFVPFYSHTSLAGVFYPQVIAPTSTPIIYAPPIIAQVPTANVQNENYQQKAASTIQKLAELKRPASQATSVKAEPGSTMAMSESSKKLLSPGGHFSSCVSVDGGCSSLAGLQTTNNDTQRNSQVDSSMEDSSDSSFYGSFLNTSSGSSCYPEQIRANYISENLTTNSKTNESTTNRRRFSIITDLKVNNFESKTMRGTPSSAQKILRKRSSGASQFIHDNQKENMKMDPPWLQNVKMTPELIYQYQMSPKSLNEVLKADMQALNNLNQPLLVNDQLDQLYLDLELAGFNTKLILDDSNKSTDSESQSNVSSQHRRIQREIEHSKMAMIYEENAPLPIS